ncbi:uncharacterized protein [Asterias amurensis]|uniref:uncharacterized protein isoform X1 n=1 Tax=Asterias amurensis TaxID=7602 RepID=UPI003AB65DB0
MQLPSGLTVLMFSSLVILSSPGLSRVSCDVRLIGGPDTAPNVGWVEIWDRNSSEWLAVCGNEDWDFDEGQVVCRELGYPGVDRAMTGTYLDGASRSVSGFQCHGTEISLERCTHSAGVMDAPCDLGQTAEVICKAPGYIGCFRDRDQIFTDTKTIEDLTTEVCLNLSRSQGGLGFIYTGTQKGNECWYGLRDQDFWSEGEDESDCNDICKGNSNQTCGGARERISIYDANLGYCDDPGTISNGNRSIRHSADDFYFGTIVEFACNTGFELQGAPSIQCTMGFKGYGVEWSNDVPECLVPITQPSTLVPVTSEMMNTQEQASDTGACAGVGAAVAFGILFIAALVGIGYWKLSTTGSKTPQAFRNEDKTLRLAKLSDLNDYSRDDQTAIETTQHEDTSNQPKDSGWVENTVYESSNDPVGPEYIEINHQPQ